METTTPSPMASATASMCSGRSGPGSMIAARVRPTMYVRVPSSVSGAGFAARMTRSPARSATSGLRLAALRDQHVRELVGDALHRVLVLVGERVLLPRIDVDLAED